MPKNLLRIATPLFHATMNRTSTVAVPPMLRTLATVTPSPINSSSVTQLPPFPPFPETSLPVLNTLVNLAQKQKNPPNLRSTLFVCGQHLLGTTISLFEALIKLGARPENIFVVGKSYSNNSQVIDQLGRLGIKHQPTSRQMALGDFVTAYNSDIFKMWMRALERAQVLGEEKSLDGIIVLDDGGHVFKNIPSEAQTLCEQIIDIEQTSSGMNDAQALGYPTIEVATSAVKQIEPPMVAEIVARKLSESLSSIRKNNPDFFVKSEPTIGIVGLGNIGQQVLLQLIRDGYKKIAVFDKKGSNVEWAENLQKQDTSLRIYAAEDLLSCIWSADILVGCTGTDITAGRLNVFQGIQNPKMLISCSSKDEEFKSLLNYIQKTRKGQPPTNPLDDIDFQNGFLSPIKIIRGGLPVNFDNGLHSVPPEDIQLIRGLKLVAILQARQLIQEWKAKGTIKIQNYMVDPKFQQLILSIWLKLQPENRFSRENRDQLLDFKSIVAKSGGILYSNNQEAPGLQCKFRASL